MYFHGRTTQIKNNEAWICYVIRNVKTREQTRS